MMIYPYISIQFLHNQSKSSLIVFNNNQKMNLKKREYPPQFLNRQPVIDNKYRLLFPLGEGRYSKVKMAIDIVTGQKVAIKLFKAKAPFSNIIISNFITEINTLVQISHRHIVRILDFKVDGIQIKNDGSRKIVLYYVMRLGENGEMFRLIHQTDGFTEKMARFYFRQIIQAINHLHKEGIAHRDVKTENIVIDKDYNIKLADFGFSCRYLGPNKKKIPMNSDVAVGTPKSNAPQVANPKVFKQYFANDLDLFAAGCVLFEICMKCVPFKTASLNDDHFRKLTEDKASFWKIFSSTTQPSSEFKDLIEGLLHVEKEKRYTIEQLMSHPWYLGEMPSKQEIRKEMNYRFKKLNNIIRQEREAYIKSKLNAKGRKNYNESAQNQVSKQFIDKELEQELSKITKILLQRDDSLSDNSSNSDSREMKIEQEKQY